MKFIPTPPNPEFQPEFQQFLSELETLLETLPDEHVRAVENAAYTEQYDRHLQQQFCPPQY